MAIEGFDYKQFAEDLAKQAGEILPPGLEKFQVNYVLNTIKNFSTLCGEAVYNDEKLNFNDKQAMLLTQIIAEWSFHKSIDLVRSGILPDYWDSVMQKIAFTIFEIAKRGLLQKTPQDDLLKIVEHHVKKTYEKVVLELLQRKVIDKSICDNALKQSNIDAMMEKMQQEQIQKQQEEAIKNVNSGSENPNNSKVLKLASLALLLKQVSQDKVQTILNKFDPKDAKTVIQYMKMPDLEKKVDPNITRKCLEEIRTNLPEPKYINPNKIMSKMNKIFEKTSKDKVQKSVAKERPNVKEFVIKAYDGEYLEIPTKVANIITSHLEESLL